MIKVRSPAGAAAAVLIPLLAACASVDVRTAKSPDANLGALHTFNVMRAPEAAPATADPANDPMLVNSVTSRALRTDVYKAVESRGYTASENPDFLVAYYASAKKKLDVTDWDYGYPFYPGWWGSYGPGWGAEWDPTVTQYTQGTVVIDVLNPQTKELLWRGQGVAEVSDDEPKYEQDLWKTVTAILDKFPRAPQGLVSSATTR
jgi:uncharacterized protein DUF4136